MKTAIILFSGRGSNMEAIINACQNQKLDLKILCVIGNQKNAKGFVKAKQLKMKNYFLKTESEILIKAKKLKPDFILLAGFLKILSPDFITAFENKIINIHPSLLPKFKGLNAQKQAWEAGETITGCTVHFVNEKLDDGKIILQNKINILKNESLESLEKRLLKLEHQTYIDALKKVLK